jgi:hypothetical protein
MIIPLSNVSSKGFNFSPPPGFSKRDLHGNYELGIDLNCNPTNGTHIFVRFRIENPKTYRDIVVNNGWMRLYIPTDFATDSTSTECKNAIIPLSEVSSQGFNFSPPPGFSKRDLHGNYELGININGEPTNGTHIFVRFRSENPETYRDTVVNNGWMQLYIPTESTSTECKNAISCQKREYPIDDDSDRHYPIRSRNRIRRLKFKQSRTKKPHKRHQIRNSDIKYMIHDHCDTCGELLQYDTTCECKFDYTYDTYWDWYHCYYSDDNGWYYCYDSDDNGW